MDNALLLPRVANGDRDGLRACIERFGGLVWSLARRSRLSQEEMEDAVQEIFLQVWKNAGRYDPSIASEVTFVAMIARRMLIDHKRKRARRPQTEELIDSQRAAPDAPAPEVGVEAAWAARALDALRPEQRQILIMTTCQGLSHEEVAQQMGMPLGTVKTHARRGLLRMREVLGAGATPAAYVGGPGR